MLQFFVEQCSQPQVDIDPNRHEATHTRMLCDAPGCRKRLRSRTRLHHDPTGLTLSPMVQHFDERVGKRR